MFFVEIIRVLKLLKTKTNFVEKDKLREDLTITYSDSFKCLSLFVNTSLSKVSRKDQIRSWKGEGNGIFSKNVWMNMTTIQSVTNIRIHSDIRIIPIKYFHIRKYSESNTTTNTFGYSFVDLKLPRIHSDIHSALFGRFSISNIFKWTFLSFN